MDLTIVIVNYNVKHFLIQCLESIQQSSGGLSFEIIVVDNASTDGSQVEIESRFPEVNYIYNKDNVGFGKANNQGIALAKGKYTLLLNPDTIIQHDTLSRCVNYLKEHPNVGGLGIKMIDGSGEYLPESKRSFPSLSVAFYKLFGLAALLPNSRQFGQYHLSYLDINQNHQVDVLSGAFLMSPTQLLQEIGGFDEDYFMYGEDIQLSYELSKKGFQNVYFSESTIVHYKGESTKKGTLNYVRHFYEAMIIFARKNLKITQQRLFIPLLQIAIVVRAFFSLSASFIQRIGLPLFDAAMSYFLSIMMTLIWLNFKENISSYPVQNYIINYPIYIFLGLVSMYFSGAYDQPYRLPKILRGGVITMVLISLVYAFLPSSLRFSRALVLLSSIAITLSVILVRLFLQYWKFGKISFYGSRKRSFFVVGSEQSLIIKDRLLNVSPLYTFFGLVGLKPTTLDQQIGEIDSLNLLTSTLKATDVLFDTQLVPYTQFVQSLERNQIRGLRFYTTNDLGGTLIHSQSKNESGQVIEVENDYLLKYNSELRKKLLFDLVASMVILILSPILIWFQAQSKFAFLNHAFAVLFGRKTWVGYIGTPESDLPVLKPGVLNPTGIQTLAFHQEVINKEINKRYAQYYSVNQDLDVLLSNLKNL